MTHASQSASCGAINPFNDEPCTLKTQHRLHRDRLMDVWFYGDAKLELIRRDAAQRTGQELASWEGNHGRL